TKEWRQQPPPKTLIQSKIFLNRETNEKAGSLITHAIYTAILGLAASGSYAQGIVSRSCIGAGAQESITVDWSFKNHLLWTASEHFRNGVFLHAINTVGKGQNGWEYTWRSYAGHLGSEFWTRRVVWHHWKNSGGLYIFLGNSIATDCNLPQWGTQ